MYIVHNVITDIVFVPLDADSCVLFGTPLTRKALKGKWSRRWYISCRHGALWPNLVCTNNVLFIFTHRRVCGLVDVVGPVAKE